MFQLILSIMIAATGPAPLADIGPAPGVELTDARGRPFDLGTLRGKVVVVSFVYTTCTGSCPATTFQLSRIRRDLKQAGLWGDRVDFVSISLDPERDTPEALRRYAEPFGADPEHWHFLTGSPERVARVLAAWDMWARRNASGILDHPSRVFLVDPRGRQREIYNLDVLRPGTVVQDIRSLLDEANGR